MNPTDYSEYLLAAKKFFAWFLPSTFGVATKMAYESRLKKLSKKYIFTALLMSCFVGWLCDMLCTYYALITFRGPIIALGALTAESAISFFFQNDKGILKAILVRLFNIKIEDPKDTKNNGGSDDNT